MRGILMKDATTQAFEKWLASLSEAAGINESDYEINSTNENSEIDNTLTTHGAAHPDAQEEIKELRARVNEIKSINIEGFDQLRETLTRVAGSLSELQNMVRQTAGKQRNPRNPRNPPKQPGKRKVSG